MRGREAIFSEELTGVLSGDLGALVDDVADLDVDRLEAEAGREADALLAAAERAWKEVLGARQELAEVEEATELPARWVRVGETLSGTLFSSVFGLISAIAVAALIGSGSVSRPVSLPNWAYLVGTWIFATGAVGALGTLVAETWRARLPSPRLVHVAEEQVRAAEANYRTALRQTGIEPWIRERINEASDLSFESRLNFRDASGLAEVAP